MAVRTWSFYGPTVRTVWLLRITERECTTGFGSCGAGALTRQMPASPSAICGPYLLCLRHRNHDCLPPHHLFISRQNLRRRPVPRELLHLLISAQPHFLPQ